jgi:hypothetical protein
MGMPPSISNVVPEGSTGTSGNDIYYTNMLYDNSLTMIEFYVLQDFNRALRLNFKQCRGAKGIKIGFMIEIPKKMQETTPSQRMQNTAANAN